MPKLHYPEQFWEFASVSKEKYCIFQGKKKNQTALLTKIIAIKLKKLIWQRCPFLLESFLTDTSGLLWTLGEGQTLSKLRFQILVGVFCCFWFFKYLLNTDFSKLYFPQLFLAKFLTCYTFFGGCKFNLIIRSYLPHSVPLPCSRHQSVLFLLLEYGRFVVFL